VVSVIFVNNVSGYKGWGCTDGSKATPEGLLLLTTLLLTLSNVFFLPAVYLALRRYLLTEALIYLATMVFSILYHACDQGFYGYCVTKYEVSVLQAGQNVSVQWFSLLLLSGTVHLNTFLESRM
jgi:hypothetical protein